MWRSHGAVSLFCCEPIPSVDCSVAASAARDVAAPSSCCLPCPLVRAAQPQPACASRAPGAACRVCPTGCSTCCSWARGSTRTKTATARFWPPTVATPTRSRPRRPPTTTSRFKPRTLRQARPPPPPHPTPAVAVGAFACAVIRGVERPFLPAPLATSQLRMHVGCPCTNAITAPPPPHTHTHTPPPPLLPHHPSPATPCFPCHTRVALAPHRKRWTVSPSFSLSHCSPSRLPSAS